jgi:hypothetical protein
MMPFESRERAALEATAILIAQRPEGLHARIVADAIRAIRSGSWTVVGANLRSVASLVPMGKLVRFNDCIRECES